MVLPTPGSIGAVDVRGGGPGTHETDALDPTTLVSTVDAVVLTGGSAYGLAAVHGVMQWCEENGRGFPAGNTPEPTVVPIVPAAAIFDLGRGGDVKARPDAAMGYEAVQNAARSADAAGNAGITGNAGTPENASAPGYASAPDLRGSVGAGTGAMVSRGRFKGGVGMASLRLGGKNDGVIVGALAVVNAFGDPVGIEPNGPGAADSSAPALNTTLVVVSTNAVLDPAEAKRTAAAAHAGLARAINPSHTLVDGDTVFTLATGVEPLDRETEFARQGSLMELQSLAAEVTRLAILDGVIAGRKG